ncbi:hypothetical protein MPSEU_001019000 [Mayamaea pseudoterrestris]|nr:hypothetical protein MPSEU_001019000 [Mayamaea pseudoterrestris]
MSEDGAAAADAPSSSKDDDEEEANRATAGEPEQLNTIDSPAQHPHLSSYRLHTPTHSVIDEDSNRFFMSEPSYSEDDRDASSGQVIRAPHRARLFGRHQSSDEDEQQQQQQRQQNRQMRRHRSPRHSAPSSPGNTSLSSWDSPAMPGRVRNLIQFHFVPPTLSSSVDFNSTGTYSQRLLPPSTSTGNNDAAAGNADDRKLPPMPNPPHRDASEVTDVDSYFLRHQLQSVTTKSPTRSSNAMLHVNDYDNLHGSFLLREGGQHRTLAADDSIAMTLSDSDDEDTANETEKNINDGSNFKLPNMVGATHASGGGNGPVRNSSTSRQVRPSNGAAHRAIQQRPTVRTITFQTKQPQQAQPHANENRRFRSGEAVATRTATGRQEWKNTRSSKRFKSTQEDDDGDDDEEDEGRHFPRKPEIIARRKTWTVGQQPRQGMQQQQLQTAEQSLLVMPASSQTTDNGLYGALSSLQQQAQIDHHSATSWPPKMLQLPPTSFGGPVKPVNVFGDALRQVGEEDDYAFHFDNDNSARATPTGHVQFATSTYSNLEHLESDIENLRPSPSNNPFANIGKTSVEKAKRAMFLPQTSSVGEQEGKNYHFYVCPRCKTRQREFFTVDDAPRQLEGPGSYLALYFSIYVIASLFIFGLEEGWETGDCIYFAVVTLTTAGLGDFVPTSWANKIICSIFIYFGVACIGLLLGSYIAGMLDDKARRDRKAKLIDSCPNCARLQTMKEASNGTTRRYKSAAVGRSDTPRLQRFSSERHVDSNANHTAIYVRDTKSRQGRKNERGAGISHTVATHRVVAAASDGSGSQLQQYNQQSLVNKGEATFPPPLAQTSSRESVHHTTGGVFEASPASSASKSSYHLSSPVTRSILDRQEHTRHDSIDFTKPGALQGGTPNRVRRMSHDNIQTSTMNENIAHEPSTFERNSDFDSNADDYSCSGSDSTSTTEEIVDEAISKVKAIKYVVLTLRQALFNSMVIIAVGCLGFWFIEGFSLVDSWYFTTVFLTTVG